MNGEHVSIRVLPDGKGTELTDGNSRGNMVKSLAPGALKVWVAWVLLLIVCILSNDLVWF